MLRKVRVPKALPFFFTGLRIASSLSVIAAVVAEYFGGLQDGLGSHIVSAASNSAYGRAWAFVAARPASWAWCSTSSLCRAMARGTDHRALRLSPPDPQPTEETR